MAATEVQVTREHALAKAKFDRVRVRHRPRLLSDNGSCHASGELRRFLDGQRMEHAPGTALLSDDAGQDRALPALDDFTPCARPGKNLIQP
jgi:transposase InsO family protein